MYLAKFQLYSSAVVMHGGKEERGTTSWNTGGGRGNLQLIFSFWRHFVLKLEVVQHTAEVSKLAVPFAVLEKFYFSFG